MSRDLNADHYLTRRWPYGEPPLIYYVRPGGSDNADGSSPATAFATLDWALHFMSIAGVNQSVIIDITGMTIDLEETLNLGGTTLGGVNFNIDFTATSPNNFFGMQHRQIRAEPLLIQALDVTAQAFDPLTNILQLTVSDALVADDLRGRFAIGAGLGEYGVIQANTGGAGPNTIQVANVVGAAMTLPVGAYGTGATMRYGDPASSEQSIYLLAECDWNLQGIAFERRDGKASALTILPKSPVTVTLCTVNSLQTESGSWSVTLDAVYHTGTFIQDGTAIRAFQSVFYTTDFLCHGSGDSGLNEWIGVIFDTCGAYGGGNFESRYSFQMSSCRFVNAVDDAIHIIFGTSRLEFVSIDNSGTNAITVTRNATAELDFVEGAGNGGVGCQVDVGSFVTAVAPTVTGAAGDVTVGAINTANWSDLPLTCGNRLSRAVLGGT